MLFLFQMNELVLVMYMEIPKLNPAEVFGKTHAGRMLDVKMDYFLDSLTLTGSGIF